jgi:hypothetical protein
MKAKIHQNEELIIVIEKIKQTSFSASNYQRMLPHPGENEVAA